MWPNINNFFKFSIFRENSWKHVFECNINDIREALKSVVFLTESQLHCLHSRFHYHYLLLTSTFENNHISPWQHNFFSSHFLFETTFPSFKLQMDFNFKFWFNVKNIYWIRFWETTKKPKNKLFLFIPIWCHRITCSFELRWIRFILSSDAESCLDLNWINWFESNLGKKCHLFKFKFNQKVWKIYLHSFWLNVCLKYCVNQKI